MGDRSAVKPSVVTRASTPYRCVAHLSSTSNKCWYRHLPAPSLGEHAPHADWEGRSRMVPAETAAATELLAVRAAELYYEENKTQDEIGAILRVTRWKVGRLLALARERGIIRIEIVHPRARRLALERDLTARYGLKDAVVVPAPPDETELQARVSEAAADYLVSHRPVPRLLGVSWGRTLHQVAEALPAGWSTAVNVVQINGGVSLSKRPGTAAAPAVMIAQKAGGQATLLPSPAILERLETKKAIEGDRTVGGVIGMARGASAYLYSAGVADTSSVHVDSGYLTSSDIAGLVERGAVGDVIVARALGATVDDAPWGTHVATADHGAVPQVTFSEPEVASVGLTSHAAREAGYEIRVIDYKLGSVAGASLHADGYRGQARMVVDVKRSVILGVTFVGQDVSELLQAATIAIVGEVPIDRLWHAVPAYPTMSEIWLRLLETYGRPGA